VSDRLVLLSTSSTVAPGLLSWPAWQVLAGASRVLVGAVDHPLLPALDEAGIGWQLLSGTDGGSGPPADVAAAAEVTLGSDVPAGPDGAPGPARVARLLTAAAAAVPGTVVWLCESWRPGGARDAAGGEPEALAQALGELDSAGAVHGTVGQVEVLPGSVDLPGGHLLRLVAVMDTLRTECPWDARQTHDSLAPHLLEESFEALEALESGEAGALREELGDVLLQVVFHARVAAERSDGTGYTVDDVADGIVTKLVRRHPHVFGDVTVSGADEVKRNWDAIKAAERESAGGGPASALDGVPFGQPALALAAQLQRRAERAGVPAELADEDAAHRDDAPGDDAHGDSAHGDAAHGDGAPGADAPGGSAPGGGADGDGAHGVGDIGSELFAMVARARAAGIDPELELRAAARRYRDRVHDWERSRPD
jgi:XTP/dITP diphosphohydrolase